MAAAKNFVRSQNTWGASPIWEPLQEKLFWVDTEEPVLVALDPATSRTQTRTLPWLAQAIGRRRGGGWIVVIRDGIALLEADGSPGRLLGNPVDGIPHMAMNHGSVGPDGRFYAGSVNVDTPDAPDGCLYRVDHDGSIEKIESGLSYPGGISFSPGGKTMYVSERSANRITTLDFDLRTGTVSNRRTLVSVPPDEGHPGGLIVDTLGRLWCGHWLGSRVTCYKPEGTKLRHIAVPVPTVTSMALGGPALSHLYVTTAKKGLSSEQLAQFPEAGDIFTTLVEIHGRLEPEFLG